MSGTVFAVTLVSALLVASSSQGAPVVKCEAINDLPTPSFVTKTARTQFYLFNIQNGASEVIIEQTDVLGPGTLALRRNYFVAQQSVGVDGIEVIKFSNGSWSFAAYIATDRTSGALNMLDYINGLSNVLYFTGSLTCSL